MNASKRNIVPLAVLSTVIIGSGIAWLTLKSSSEDNKNSENKNLTGQAQEAKENIDTEEVRGRLQNSMEMIKTMSVQLQSIYERYGRDLLQQIQQRQLDSKEIADTAKKAGEEVQNTAQQEGQEAVQEMQKTKDEAKQGVSSSKQKQDNAYSHDPQGPFGSN